MELTKEFIEENKLEEAQVTAITALATDHITTLKGEWDGKANKDAEAILHDATKKIEEITGVKHEQGQKVGDFIGESWTKFSETKTKELDDKISEYDTKIKNTSGSEALTKEFEELKGKHSDLQKKEASFDEILSSGVKDKYEKLQSDHSVMKLEVAFNTVKPNFPDAVNGYEASAKWDMFKKKTLESSTLELVEGEWLAIDKENKHKSTKLTDLIGKDTDITKLMEGRQQTGPNGKPTLLKTIEGVPFEVPENATGPERSKLIKDHLLSKGVSQTGTEYPTQFAALNKKILDSLAA